MKNPCSLKLIFGLAFSTFLIVPNAAGADSASKTEPLIFKPDTTQTAPSADAGSKLMLNPQPLPPGMVAPDEGSVNPGPIQRLDAGSKDPAAGMNKLMLNPQPLPPGRAADAKFGGAASDLDLVSPTGIGVLKHADAASPTLMMRKAGGDPKLGKANQTEMASPKVKRRLKLGKGTNMSDHGQNDSNKPGAGKGSSTSMSDHGQNDSNKSGKGQGDASNLSDHAADH
jgi:hypothetical protein